MRIPLTIVTAVLLLFTPAAAGAQAGVAAPQAVPLHVLKIVAGPSGSEINGGFVLTQERSEFNRSDDRDVFVFLPATSTCCRAALRAILRTQTVDLPRFALR
jgi:hypothetical protein